MNSAALGRSLGRRKAPAVALPLAPLAAIGRAIKPSDAEIAANPRARSAVLRVAQRTRAPLPAGWPRGFDAGLQ